MLKKIALGLVVLVLAFLGFASTKESKFHYERSGVIKAPPEKIYPYISNFKLGGEWSPYEKVDPNMKKTFSGEAGQVGSKMEFDGNNEAGSGHLEILSAVPNKQVGIRLIMTKPFHAENLVVYTLTPEAEGTRFSWAMSGDGGFLGKIMNTLIDCEKMVADQFVVGINNLRALIEAQK